MPLGRLTRRPRLRAAFARPASTASATRRRDVDAVVAAILADVRAARRRGAGRLHRGASTASASTAADLRVSADEIDRGADAGPTRDAVAALRAGGRAHRRLPPRQMPADLDYADAAGVRLGCALDADRRGRALRAGRHGGLSQLGADERDAGQGRRRRRASSWSCRRRTACSIRWCSPPPASPASTRSTASAAPRRWRRSPTAPRRSAPVDKIVGPGNAYVAAAKRQVFGTVGIDMIAGPSEILVVADGANDPAWIAADLLSQAEHDAAAQSILITDDAGFADAVAAAVDGHLRDAAARRDRRARAGASTAPSSSSRSLDDAVPLVDRLAPEHLELAVAEPDALAERDPPRRRHLPRPPHAGGDRRLRRRAEPRAADRAQRALRLGPRRARFPEAHDPGRLRPGEPGRDRPGRRARWPRPRGSTPMRCRSRSASRRADHHDRRATTPASPSKAIASSTSDARRAHGVRRSRRGRARARGRDLRPARGEHASRLVEQPDAGPYHLRSVARGQPAALRHRDAETASRSTRVMLPLAPFRRIVQGLLHGLRELLRRDQAREPVADRGDRHGPARPAQRGLRTAARAAGRARSRSTTTRRAACSR